MSQSKESWLETLLMLWKFRYYKCSWEALLQIIKKQHFSIILLYYKLSVYLITVIFQLGILSNFSVFWLNDVVAVSCMYFNGTLIIFTSRYISFCIFNCKANFVGVHSFSMIIWVTLTKKRKISNIFHLLSPCESSSREA